MGTDRGWYLDETHDLTDEQVQEAARIGRDRAVGAPPPPTGGASGAAPESPEAQKSTADLALQRSKSRHAAWCFLPADHDGACDGDQ